MKRKKLLTILLSVAMLLGVMGVAAACGDAGVQSSSPIVQNKTSATVQFDINLDGYQTNTVKDKTIKLGKRIPIVKAYVTGENPNNLQLYGWYTDKACTNQWDFKQDRVEGDMTLYAKWVEQYNVNYYVNGELIKTDLAFKGDKLIEDAQLVEGFKYLGTYVDADYQTAYDYNSLVSGNIDLYVKRSAGIYLSDHTNAGELASSSLSDYLVAYVGSYSTDSKGNYIEEEGWVEPYTVTTNTADGAVEEKCTYVNFGYQPNYGDGYVELCLSLDITQSQIIRVWFKNLGKADSLNMYFTALLDAENTVYSETGAVYTQNFCYPNYSGSEVAGGIELDETQIEMDETAEWTYVDFNLYEVYKNGYSIWGTSSYLGMIRLQANYKNVDEDDWSNEFLIKAIEGVPYDIVVEDSEQVKNLITDAKETTAQALEAACTMQLSNPNGLVFPKDFEAANITVEDGAEFYNTVNGLLFYAENQIVGREKGNPSYGITLEVPKGKSIDLEKLTTFDITLKNYGYAENLSVRVYNDIGIPVKAEMKLTKRLADSKTYTANLYGKYGMEGTLSKIEIRYSSIGVDNALVIENVSMSEFVPYDIVGLNLNDKNCFGIASTADVAVSFDSNREGTLFEVAKSGASVVSVDKTYDATSDGYAYATLQYYLHKDSNVSAVTVEYKIGEAFTSRYVYELDTQNKANVNTVKLPLKAEERGYVKAIRLTFTGKGKVVIKSIGYEVGAESLPYYQSYDDIYKGYDWEDPTTYVYDNALKASVFMKAPTQESLGFSIYIAYSVARKDHISVPHSTKNVLVTPTTKIKIVYQNRTEANTMNVIAGFSPTEMGVSDGEGRPSYESYNNPIDCMMQEYEWSTLTIEIPADRANEYLAKINVQFGGKEIAIRAISIETGR